MTHLDLFSGIGGFAIAAQRLGIKTTQFVEVNPYCQEILRKNFPGVAIHGDIRTFEPYEAWDVVTAGFPCQDISSANPNGAGLQGERSGLFFEITRLVRQIRPRFLVLENSTALLNFRGGRDMGTILWELSCCGYHAEWSAVSGCSMGAPHMRKRLLIVAYADSIDGEIGLALHEDNQRPIQAIYDRSSNSPWAKTPPSFSGVANGVPNRVDRVRALGNSIIPDIAELALSRAMRYAPLAQEVC
ncbi:DNA cytosine methyltransferase [Leptolyngbya sp. Heron Island J]|uniref:DNA cytosine methyltransferase n=1 Tax=Leptolyngbya sp. Heron Island J TaxID=1385935 RepID=UPI0003FF3BB7|nr:DNA (cytosine-5-)-methyltransferase [Leptolyngbya sp. Heron Island J]